MERARGEKTRKKPYRRPTLRVHGDVEKLTEALRLAATKGGATSSRLL